MSNRNIVKHHGGLGTNPDGTQLYASVPMELARDPKLTHTARSVALYVWSHAPTRHQSANHTADALGTTRKTVAAALDNLQEHGWLVRQQHTKPGNDKPSYEIWHLQLSNTPFTTGEASKLSGVSKNDSPLSDPTCVETTQVGESKRLRGVSRNDSGTCVETTHHSSSLRSAPRSALSSGDPMGEDITEDHQGLGDGAVESVVAAGAALEAIHEDGLPVEEESYGYLVVPEGVEQATAAREAADLTRKIIQADPWAVSPLEQWANERPAVTRV